jgi:hypothetical protein
MRSYGVNEVIVFPVGGTKVSVQSLCGRIILGKAASGVSFRQEVTEPLRQQEKHSKHEKVFGFGYYRAPFGDVLSLRIPNWFLVAAFATLGVLSWACRIKRRFSLRTLLIATTVVAIVLGLIVTFR